jgi:hypothetical protein
LNLPIHKRTRPFYCLALREVVAIIGTMSLGGIQWKSYGGRWERVGVLTQKCSFQKPKIRLMLPKWSATGAMFVSRVSSTRWPVEKKSESGVALLNANVVASYGNAVALPNASR